jgi:hypothetical protein
MSTTTFVQACGIWGALIGTASFVWQVLNRRMRISVSAEADENPWAKTLRVTVRNRGAKATTLERIDVTFEDHGCQNSYNVGACFHESVKLPVKIEPGGSWSALCAAKFDDAEELSRMHDWVARDEIARAHCRLRFSHQDRWTSVGIANQREFD